MFVGLVTSVTTIDGQSKIRMPNHPSCVAVLDTMSEQNMRNLFRIRSPECGLLLRRRGNDRMTNETRMPKHDIRTAAMGEGFLPRLREHLSVPSGSSNGR